MRRRLLIAAIFLLAGEGGIGASGYRVRLVCWDQPKPLIRRGPRIG